MQQPTHWSTVPSPLSSRTFTAFTYNSHFLCQSIICTSYRTDLLFTGIYLFPPNPLDLDFFKNWGHTPHRHHWVLPGGEGQVTSSQACQAKLCTIAPSLMQCGQETATALGGITECVCTGCGCLKFNIDLQGFFHLKTYCS